MKRILPVLFATAFILPMMAIAQTPTASHVQSTIAGTALHLLPDTNNGEVEVIAAGEPNAQGYIPIVVRNNSDITVGGATAQVAARDAAGKLVGVGETLINHAMKPYLLNPGDIAIGFIVVQGGVPDGAELTFSATASEPDGFLAARYTDVEFREVNWLQDRIVGEIINRSDKDLEEVYLMVTCFDSEGTPLLSDVMTVGVGVGAKSGTLFQMGGVFSDLSLCENYLIAGTGTSS